MASVEKLSNKFDYPSGRIESLDLLRGIAAVSVLIYHTEPYLGAQLLPRAYLAVDLFFVLSGFVIAQNYDRRLATRMSVWQFMIQRIIRLYPCYLLALVVGFILASIRMIRDEGYIDGYGLTIAAGFNLFMLPALNPLYHHPGLFTFNGASWSIFFEMVANLIYGLCFRFLSGVTIAAFVLIGAAGLVLGVSLWGTVDLGMRATDLVYGLPRVLFSFFAGVALRRYLSVSLPTRTGPWRAGLLSVALVALFYVSAMVPRQWSSVADLVIVFLCMPLLVAVASRMRVDGFVRQISIWAGDASYPVYLLQTPFFVLFAALVEVLLHTKAAHLTPWGGIVTIVTVILISIVVDRYYELPLRARIKRAIAQRSARISPVRTSNADHRISEVD